LAQGIRRLVDSALYFLLASCEATLMEVLVTETIGLPEDAIVSIRFGTTRRQAPLETVSTHPLKFPTALEAVAEPLKIDILAPIATTRLVLHPSEDQYRIGFEQSDDMLIGLNVRTTSGIDKPETSSSGRPISATPKFQDAAASARDYLEEHGLLRYVQSLLHAVIQVKPKDPYSFMMEQLGAAQTKTKPKSRPASASTIGRPPTGPPPTRPRPQTANFHGRLQPVTPQAEPPMLLPLSMTTPEEDLATFGTRNEVSTEAVKATEELTKDATEPTTTVVAPVNEELEKLRQELRGAMDKAYATGTLAEAISPRTKPTAPEDTQKQSESTPEVTVATELPAKTEIQAKTEETSAKVEETPATTQETQAKVEETPATIEELSKKTEETQGATQATEAQPQEIQSNTAETAAKTSEQPSRTDELKAAANDAEATTSAANMPTAAELELEQLRLRMRNLMEKAYESGDLAKAVDATIAKTRGPTPEESKTSDEDCLDELKSKMCKLLVDAADTGRLESAVKAVAANRSSSDVQPADAPPVVPELKELKEKIRGLFQDAADSGQLASALESIRSKKEAQQTTESTPAEVSKGEDLTALKANIRNLLSQATESGELAQALKVMDERKKQVQELRPDAAAFLSKMKDERERQVVEASKAASAEESKSTKEKDVEDLKATLRAVMTEATESGKLLAALETIKGPLSSAAPIATEAAKVDESTKDLDDMKAKLRELLGEATQSGTLASALDKVAKESPRPVIQVSELEELKVNLRGLLQNAAESGKLAEALEIVVQNTPKVPLTPSMEVTLIPATEAPPTLVVEAPATESQDVPLSPTAAQREEEFLHLQEEISTMREESRTLHGHVDRLAREMEDLKRINEELVARLAPKP
jgi:uncharacterized coiled-coil DUF342 family protein